MMASSCTPAFRWVRDIDPPNSSSPTRAQPGRCAVAGREAATVSGLMWQLWE